MQSFVNSKPAPPVGFDAVQEVERLKCDRDKDKEKSKQLELDLRRMESKLLELYTSWPKFAFGISLNANSLSSDINEAHMKTRDPRIVQSFKRKCKVYLKIAVHVYLKIAVHASGPGLL